MAKKNQTTDLKEEPRDIPDETQVETPGSEFNIDDYITFEETARQLNKNLTVIILWCKTQLLVPVRNPGFAARFMLKKSELNALLSVSALKVKEVK